jgi:hypothetical protein
MIRSVGGTPNYGTRQQVTRRFYPVVRSSIKCLPSPCCDEGCTQPLSSDPLINLSTTILFLISTFSCCEESPQFGVSHALHILISNELKSKRE